MDTHMVCSCIMRALGLPKIPVNRALLKETAPWVAHTSPCSGLQPWDTTWEVQWASRSQISTISSVHPVHGIPGQEHVYSTAVSVVCTGCREGGGDGGDSQLSRSHVQHMTYLRKASSSVWQESLHFLDSYVTGFVSYFGNIPDFCVIFLKPFALQVCFSSNNLSLLE